MTTEMAEQNVCGQCNADGRKELRVSGQVRRVKRFGPCDTRKISVGLRTGTDRPGNIGWAWTLQAEAELWRELENVAAL